ncbi:hypothetical protein DAPPUDRAFT_14394, partial [Daphnia pulex]
QLSSLYDMKPPISKAKMTAITKGAIKAVKFYKHVVQSVEKFLQKCRPEYKIPGLYVIDSIVRQSRHQFGADKDVFAPRFSKNVTYTFYFIYQCTGEEKSKVIRVLNLWQKNAVFPPEVIQPLFDMADSSLPPTKKEALSVCSTTLWVGHLSKLVQQEELSDTFGQYGEILSIDLIPPRGCAFVCMHRRQDAYRALTKLAGHKLQGKAITLAWAPGKGVKAKEWKDFWEVDQGVSYVPWQRLSQMTDLEALEEGGSFDEETLPP